MKISLLLFMLFLSSCTSGIKTFGIYNSSSEEIIIETSPIIRYNGLPEKFIGLRSDPTNRGVIWKYGYIDCIITYPLSESDRHYSEVHRISNKGVYILKPNSAHELGYVYVPKDGELSAECIRIDSMTVYTKNDTMIYKGKNEIWEALNFDFSNRNDRKNKKYKHVRQIFDKGINFVR